MTPPSTAANDCCLQSNGAALDQLFQRTFDLLRLNLAADPLVDVADRRLGVALVFEYQRGQAMRFNALQGGFTGEVETAQQARINKVARGLSASGTLHQLPIQQALEPGGRGIARGEFKLGGQLTGD